MIILCVASDILIVYLGIELQSLAFYILATFNWRSDYNVEAGLKYFILGAFSSCLLTFGFSALYLVLGSTSFEALLNLCQESTTFDLPLFGLTFLLVALLFKVGASPFHTWLCDVYEGSMTPVTLFFALVPKVVIFYLMFKFLLLVFLPQDASWHFVIGVSAFLSITVASLGALHQKKIKRLLAFSAISHTGFILLAICCCSTNAMKAYNFYILFYVIMNVTFFSIILISKTKQIF
jgi:NADH-quinone oxidoreductase subunit N